MRRQHQNSEPTEQFSFESLLFGEPSEAEPAAKLPVETPQTSGTLDELSVPPRPVLVEESASSPGGDEPKKADFAKRQVDEGIRVLAAELEAGHSEALVRWLNTMSRFHQYSLNNTLLIAWQRPDATHVAGFSTWKGMGRSVKKGEKGILILAPIPKHRAPRKSRANASSNKDSEEERAAEEQPGSARGAVWGFRAAYVFDVSQTEGEELPAFATVQGDPADQLNRLKDLIADQGIELTYSDNLQGAFGRSLKGRIEVLKGLTAAHEFSVLVHELAHELLHKDADRRAQTSKTVRETEAEAVSFVVCRAIGLDSSSQHADYIQLYQGSVETLSTSLEAIRSTSNRILADLALGGTHS